MKKNHILIAIPTYNEHDNIQPLYEKLKNLDLNPDILFIDVNSPDGTGSVINTLIQQDKSVHVIHRKEKLGLGTAQRASYDFAQNNNYDYLITMDADFTHDPQYIPHMYAKRHAADVIIGSRYAQGAAMHGWTSFRLPFTLFWRFMIKTFLGLPYDCTGAFRLYNVKILKPEIYNSLTAKGFAFGMELLYRLVQNGARVAEVPIQAHSRIHGESKLSGAIMREAAWQFLRLSADRFKHALQG